MPEKVFFSGHHIALTVQDVKGIAYCLQPSVFSEKYHYIVYDCHADKPWYFSCPITVPNKWFTYNHRLHNIYYIIYNTTCDTNYNVEFEFGLGLLRTSGPNM